MADPVRIDRRKRHADDPAISVTVVLPVSVLTALDDWVVANRYTRSGAIKCAVTEMLRDKMKAKRKTRISARTRLYPDARAKSRQKRL